MELEVSPNDEHLDFRDIVNILYEDLTREGYTISTLYEEEPSLPIDFYCKKTIGKTPEYIFILVASLKNISKEFQKKLMFYQYYLSYDYKPWQYKVILAIPASSTIELIPFYASTEEDRKKDFYKENGFGLWKVNKEHIDKETYNAISLWDRINRDYVDIIAKTDKKLLEVSDKVTYFTDKYVHDAILGIRGDPTDPIRGIIPIKFEERHIDAKLLQMNLKLNNISYKDYLFKVIGEHLSYKGNEYEFIKKVFSELWEDLIGVSYNDFLDIFDPALQHIFAEESSIKKRVHRYRDHYIHQFQVFLSGLLIIDSQYEEFSRRYKEPEICWLITSSFHDMAYPVQLYDEWSDIFFKKVFNVGHMGGLELKTKFIDNSFLSCISRLLTRLCSVFMGEEMNENWYVDKNSLIQCFHREITEPKNHCILSSISLLKIIQEQYANKIRVAELEYNDILENIVVPCALSIALHDDDLWKQLKDKKHWEKLGEKCPIPLIKYETDPLTFLLIFCDSFQEWGRPFKSKEEYYIEEGKQLFYLKDFSCDPTAGFCVTLRTLNQKRDEKFFVRKEDELKEISAFLQQPSHTSFTIRIEDDDGNGENYPMVGCS